MSTVDDLNIRITATHNPRLAVAMLLEGLHALLQNAVDEDDYDRVQTILDDLLTYRASLMAAVFVDTHST